MPIYDFVVLDSNLKETKMSEYKGKVLLIINSAPRCRFAIQFFELQKIYMDFKDAGFEILNFPCNQFMFQASGSNHKLKSHCKKKYGISFRSFTKIKVNGKDTHPLYRYLKKEGPDELTPKPLSEMKIFFRKFKRKSRRNDIHWNFTKFLIDRNGNIVYRFSPNFEPKDIRPYIETLILNK
ncbi:MAG: glutathione peroxidase [Acholeplasmataceae bacterium]|nr:glutathione peroxidase [Acholeplasmataceae bacterium]